MNKSGHRIESINKEKTQNPAMGIIKNKGKKADFSIFPYMPLVYRFARANNLAPTKRGIK